MADGACAGRRGRGPDAADAVRASPGLRAWPQDHRGQQDRPQQRRARRDGRGNARPVLELAEESWQLDAPVVTPTRGRAGDGRPTHPGATLEPLLDAILENVPPPIADPVGPLQMLVSNLDHDDWSGRLALGRIQRGTVHPGSAWCAARRRVGRSCGSHGAHRRGAPSACGRPRDRRRDRLSIGLAAVAIGDTLADAELPRRCRASRSRAHVRMNFVVNQSPSQVARQPSAARHDSCARVSTGAADQRGVACRGRTAADIFDVSGRGELHLAILIETMRREGYEFEVSRPAVITKGSTASAWNPSRTASSTARRTSSAHDRRARYAWGKMTAMRTDAGGGCD